VTSIHTTACAVFSLMKVAADLFQSIIASRLSIRSLLLLKMCAVTAWIAGHAAELAIDPNCLAVAGDSAGGTLAAVVCQSAKHSGLKIALQVLLCPVTDIAPDTQSRREFAEGYFLEGPLMSWAGTHYLPSGFDVSDPRLSPLRAGPFGTASRPYPHRKFRPTARRGASICRCARTRWRQGITSAMSI
jgi:hypothetical protein